MPIFADFVLLPAARQLWEPKVAGAIDSSAWTAARVAIDEDINEWRVGARLAALKLGFANMYELDDQEELAADADEYAPWQDDHFRCLTAAVVCTVKGCYRSGRPGFPGRPTFFGSLSAVLQHQIDAHADLEPSSEHLQDAASPPPYRFDLPLEVSNSFLALCDLLELNEAHATIEDVDAFFAAHEGARLQWFNVPVTAAAALRLKRSGNKTVHPDGKHWWTKEGPKERDWRKVVSQNHPRALVWRHQLTPRR